MHDCNSDALVTWCLNDAKAAMATCSVPEMFTCLSNYALCLEWNTRDRVPDHVPAVPPRLAHFRYRLRHKSLLHYYSICTCTVDVYWHAFRGYAAYHSSTLNGWWEGLPIHILKLFYHLHWSLLAMLISIYYCATFSLNVCLCYLCTQSVSYILFIALFAKFSPSTASDCIKVKSLGTRLCSTCVYIATVFSSPTKWLHKIKDR